MTGEIRKARDVPSPEGPRCLRCSKVVREDGHGGWCSSDCRESAVQDVSQSTLRRQVYLRDGGVCGLCGLDAEQLRAEIDGLMTDRGHVDGGWNRYHARVHQLVRLGFDRHVITSGSSFWELHHAVERAAGGAHTLANSVTACIPCHAKASKGFAQKRAKLRRPR